MPANSNQESPNQNEIDLLTLFSKLGESIKKGFLGLVHLIGAVLVFLLRKWYYFGIAVILAGLTAVVLNNVSDPVFYSDLVIRSNATPNQTIMSSLDKLGNYAGRSNYSELSDKLNMSTEDAGKLKGLETFWYYDIGDDGIYDGIDTERRFLSDTNIVKVEQEFVVRASVKDPVILEKLETGLVQYLEANPFLEALNRQRLSDLKTSINQTQYEIEKLDSLQKREYYTNPDQLRQKEGQIVFTTENIVPTYHNDMFRLLQQKQEYEGELNIYSDLVTIVEGFSIPVKPENGTIKYAKKLVWYYLGLALIVSLLINYRKKIWIH